MKTSTQLGLSLLVALSALGCGARSALDLGAPDAGVLSTFVDPDDDDDPDAGRMPDAGQAPIDDAGMPDDASTPCAWGPGLIGAWRVPNDEGDLAALYHVDPDGRVSASILSDESGAAFGMGIAEREGTLGVSWRVRRADGTNVIRFALVRGGCVAGEPRSVYEGDIVQSFRGSLVATASGWLVLGVATGGLWARPLDPDGAPSGAVRVVSATADARFSVASSGARAAVLFVEDGVVQLAELAPDGTRLTTTPISRADGTASEPRLVALESGWGGTYLAGDALFAFSLGWDEAVATLARVGSACTRCVSDPSYLLPAAATDGRTIAALWPREEGGDRELVFATIEPGAPAIAGSMTIARGETVRWPALGYDGTGWVAVHDEAPGTVRVTRIGRSGPTDVDSMTLAGSQRLPALVRVR